jgi:hypothetical protein
LFLSAFAGTGVAQSEITDLAVLKTGPGKTIESIAKGLESTFAPELYLQKRLCDICAFTGFVCPYDIFNSNFMGIPALHQSRKLESKTGMFQTCCVRYSALRRVFFQRALRQYVEQLAFKRPARWSSNDSL